MTPAQFYGRLKKPPLPSVCLFLGSEAYEKRRCREALIAAHLGAPGTPARESGFTMYDGAEMGLAEIVDDARALSLFASERLILVTGAEVLMPRSSRSAAVDDDGDDEGSAPAGSAAVLHQYAKHPSPGVVLLFEATRFGFDGDEKRKADRARKFFDAADEVVEFHRYTPDEARAELQSLVKTLNVRIEPAASAMLIDSLAADMGRIATELEKLAAYTAGGRTITVADIPLLIPDARESTIFALVNALGRGDRARALASLDALCREGEYLPLALAFLSTQFRQALAARKAGLRSAGQVQGYFSKVGVAMWGSRAEQVSQTAQKFSTEQLEAALKLIFEADRDLRSARPDDRIVMENFVVRLTTA